MKTTHQQPSGTFIREFLADAALRIASIRLVQNLEVTVQKITPVVVVTLAAARFPGMDIRQSVEHFNDEIIALSNEIDQLEIACKTVFDAENARLKPIVSLASREMLSTIGAARSAKSPLENTEIAFNEQTVRQAKSRLTPDEIALVHDRCAHDGRVEAMRQQLAELENRHIALAVFCHSKDLSDLPEGLANIGKGV